MKGYTGLNLKVSIGDIADKWTILRMKVRLSEESRFEFNDYNAEFNKNPVPLDLLADLIEANAKIWALESDIRNGRELPLEEVGRRALMIRDINKQRIEAKNKINELFGDYKEHKVNHASGN